MAGALRNPRPRARAATSITTVSPSLPRHEPLRASSNQQPRCHRHRHRHRHRGRGNVSTERFGALRTDRDYHRVRAELRKERLRAEKLQRDLAQAEQERASLQGQSSAKTEEIAGLRQDLVALVAKVQRCETVLAQRTSLYEAAIAQVEKLSLKHAREKRNRRGAEEVVRGLDLTVGACGRHGRGQEQRHEPTSQSQPQAHTQAQAQRQRQAEHGRGWWWWRLRHLSLRGRGCDGTIAYNTCIWYIFDFVRSCRQ